MTTVTAALQRAVWRLQGASDSPRLDAEVLLAHLLGKPRSHLCAWPAAALAPVQTKEFARLVWAREQGTPVAYLTGEKEFWSLRIRVGPQVLIPRPDTELLVEQALLHLPPEQLALVLELGTGSGAIALAIAHERPLAHLLATDISAAALAVAQANAQALRLTNIEFLASNWFADLGNRHFDMIVANPPYICRDDPHLRQGDLRFEPADALVGGADGLVAIGVIARESSNHLRPGGWILLEHGFEQGEPAREMLRQHFEQVGTTRDLAGRERVSFGRNPQI